MSPEFWAIIGVGVGVMGVSAGVLASHLRGHLGFSPRRLQAVAVAAISLVVVCLPVQAQDELTLEHRKAIAAAETGDAMAQWGLGMMYDNGYLGVPQDPAEAAVWYRKAAEQGNVPAQRNLGYMYATGRGVPQDDVEAVAWYRQAADQGDSSSKTALGEAYADGRGVPQDNQEAEKLFRQAAEQGNASAQYNLGVMYFNGRGVPQDDVEAAAWYRQAAEQGVVSAQYNLGLVYSEGKGVPQDNVEAHMWLNLASSRSSGADRERSVATRDRVAELMTPADLSEAQRRAREWYAAHPVP